MDGIGWGDDWMGLDGGMIGWDWMGVDWMGLEDWMSWKKII